MAITIKLEGLHTGKAAIRKLATLMPQKARELVNEAAINVHRGAQQRAPVDVGRLRDSYKWELTESGLTGTVYSDSKYAPHVEFGTKPHFPPVAPLEEWARRHGMPGAGYVIARKIAQRGTPAKPHLTPAWEAERPEFVRKARQAVQDAAKESAS